MDAHSHLRICNARANLNHDICKFCETRREGKPKLQAVNITHVYPGGVKALENVNLAIGTGELVALIGLS
jgi:ABC-type transport system involved in cytochrome bd biosynthesis fused ATPase/permease subunit